MISGKEREVELFVFTPQGWMSPLHVGKGFALRRFRRMEGEDAARRALSVPINDEGSEGRDSRNIRRRNHDGRAFFYLFYHYQLRKRRQLSLSKTPRTTPKLLSLLLQKMTRTSMLLLVVLHIDTTNKNNRSHL